MNKRQRKKLEKMQWKVCTADTLILTINSADLQAPMVSVYVNGVRNELSIGGKGKYIPAGATVSLGRPE